MDTDEFEELLRIQRLVTDRLSVEAKMDRKIKLFDLVRSTVSGKENSVQIEIVIIESQMDGFNPDETQKLLDELQSDKMIMMQDGKIFLI